METKGRETATKLKEDFDDFMSSMKRLMELAVDGLEPTATARRRREIQGALKEFLSNAD